MKVVIIGLFPDTAKDRIRRSFPCAWDVRIVVPEEAEQELTDADVLIPEHIRIDDEILRKAPKLKLVQTGAGYDNVDLHACTMHGVQVCNAAGVNANAVAEHVLAFILCWYKNIAKLDKALKTGSDEGGFSYCGAELTGKTIGLVGFWHVGKKVAEYCNAFHMNVLAYSRTPIEAAGIEQRDLDSLVRDSDIVSLHVPLTEQTRHMINADVLAKMKSDAVLINTSRGGVVDEPQLLHALQKGQIGGACLDVFEDEPLRPDHPFRSLENVILTPHTAGLPDGVKYHRKRYDFFVRNIKRVMNNEIPDCRINHPVR
ncbi:MAG: phosphoglycerate dehydrogenase [Clostridia bacterium]|nr:phosphoglycerate dehydrogenase [Clostridia bacterium]